MWRLLTPSPASAKRVALPVLGLDVRHREIRSAHLRKRNGRRVVVLGRDVLHHDAWELSSELDHFRLEPLAGIPA